MHIKRVIFAKNTSLNGQGRQRQKYSSIAFIYFRSLSLNNVITLADEASIHTPYKDVNLESRMKRHYMGSQPVSI